MKRKRLIAAFLSLMLVVTVVMPAASATGYTGLWSSVENTQTEGETPATETPAEDTGASDEGTDQAPTDPDDTGTSDEGTEQTPTDPDDTDTSDEETATDPDDTDTSDEETATDPDDTDTSDEQTPDEPETPVEEPTDPETPVEEPTNPETPEQLPTEPETPVEEVPELPANELLPAEPVPLAEGPLTVFVVTTTSNEPITSFTLEPDQYTEEYDCYMEWHEIPNNLYDADESYTYYEARANTYDGTSITHIRYVPRHYEGWNYVESTWQYRDDSYWGSAETLNALYLVYDDGSVTLSFDGNGGQGNVGSLSGQPNTSVALPENDFTRNGYTFVGWAEQAVTLPDENYTGDILKPGSSYTMPAEDTTLYAVWQNNNADNTGYFYIRIDGEIPDEPNKNDAGDYTIGIQVPNAVTEQVFISDSDATDSIINGGESGFYIANDVTQALNAFPTTNQIQRVINYYNAHNQGGTDIGYNPNDYYIHWYVHKYQGAGAEALMADGSIQATTNLGQVWHIDGVLLKKELVTITYRANRPAGVPDIVNVPNGYQVDSGTTITVGESGSVGGSMDRANPEIEGYTFRGWNTEPDGSGTWYYNYDKIEMTENVTLYAQWTSGNDTILRLNKVDGMREPLAGVGFTITADGFSDTFITTEAVHEVRNIQTDVVYTITETSAPAGYETLAEPFHFKVGYVDSTLTAYLCDEEGIQLTGDALPSDVELTYNGGIVNITVTNIGYFYIFHTADIESGPYVEEIPIDEEHVSGGTFDIVNHTEGGYLYGGYYSDYGGRGSYETPSTPYAQAEPDVSMEGASTYTGGAGVWKKTNAYTESGYTMHPEAGVTYYLKEVPQVYLQPYMHIVYDKNSQPANLLKQMYLMTGVDDLNYSEIGLDVTNITTGTRKTVATFKVQDTVGGTTETLSTQSIWNVKGFLGVWDQTNDLKEDLEFSYQPYFETPDGVTVYGKTTRSVYTQDNHYYGTFEQNVENPGIYRVDN